MPSFSNIHFFLQIIIYINSQLLVTMMYGAETIEPKPLFPPAIKFVITLLKINTIMYKRNSFVQSPRASNTWLDGKIPQPK